MLSEEQIGFFRENGFLCIERLIDAQTVETLRDYYDRILRREIRIGGDRMLGGLVRQVMVPSVELAFFRDNPALRTGGEVARQLLDVEEVTFFFDMLISKEPGQLNDTPWHNDYAYSAVPVAPPGRAGPTYLISGVGEVEPG